MTQIIAICPKNRTEGTLSYADKTYPCIFGKNGLTADKQEGDMATPIGSFPLRRCFYREDRLENVPQTDLKLHKISKKDGWCDDSQHALYNQLVKLPFEASHENLWFEDQAYDLFIELGYNDDPIVPGKGSAIFLHVMHEDKRPTAGCLSLEKKHLLELISFLKRGTLIEIKEE